MDCVEIEIPAVWGHIAVRIWGSRDDPIILLFHGILDNVGTFTRLISLLPKNYCYACVDLPGHGKSSHWPSKTFLNTVDNILTYETVYRYFKQEKYIIIGHSYGGQLAFLFAQLYPDKVERLVMLDTIYLFPVPTYRMKDVLLEQFDEYFNMIPKLERNSPPSYTRDEALSKVIENRRYGVLSEQAAAPLAERMLVPHDDGKVHFSIDQRIKFARALMFDLRVTLDFIKKNPVRCPVLIVLARDSDLQQVYFNRLLKYYKSRKNFRIINVEGNHDVHNVNPERIAPLITHFLIVRIWGNRKNPPVLMIHGILDNVGSYTRLIPSLPTNHHYICVDLPGHGKSAHFKGTLITPLDFIPTFTIITNHFKQEQYTIVGHSFGGQLSYFFAQLYPERVAKLVLLDVVYFNPLPIASMKKFIRQRQEMYITLVANQREYNEEEALEIVMSKRIVGKLTREAAIPILERVMLKRGNGKLTLGYDQRLRFIQNLLFTPDNIIQFVEENALECPVLVLLSKDSLKAHERSKKVLDFYRSKPNMRIQIVDGNHDVHNIHPERVAPILSSFLSRKSNL